MKKDQIPETATELVDYLLEHESKLKQVDRGQMKEIIAVLSDAINEEFEDNDSRYIIEALIKNGARRAKRYNKNT